MKIKNAQSVAKDQTQSALVENQYTFSFKPRHSKEGLMFEVGEVDCATFTYILASD